MKREDQVFWERLADMPWIEAEQECVSRRERLVLELTALHAEGQKVTNKGLREELRAEICDRQGQCAMLNERLRYLRDALFRVKWGQAVKTLYGEEAFAACREFIAAEEARIRREDPPKPPGGGVSVSSAG